MDEERSERGKPATFDRRSGAVHGSGSGAGGEGNPDEDYDADPMAGAGAEPDGAPRPAAAPPPRIRRARLSMSGRGHPLPASNEARHDEIPEHLERDKGRGDDPAAPVQPPGRKVAPDGEPYGDANG